MQIPDSCVIKLSPTCILSKYLACQFLCHFFILRHRRYSFHSTLHWWIYMGACPAHAPTYGPIFFRFDMQNVWNVTVSGVHAPSTRSTPPPLREILDPPLHYVTLFMSHCSWYFVSSEQYQTKNRAYFTTVDRPIQRSVLYIWCKLYF